MCSDCRERSMSREDLGEEMSESDIASIFGEKVPKGKVIKNPEHEIYRISARINNETVSALGFNNINPEQRMICNTFAHTLKALYDFADKMKAKKSKEGLLKLIEAQEKTAANLIAALASGVK